jgi:hypothetical protein
MNYEPEATADDLYPYNVVERENWNAVQEANEQADEGRWE